MSKGGIPVQPYYVLGGFIDPDVTGGGLGENPDYTKAKAVDMTFVVDNYDIYSEDYATKKALSRAKEWEKAYIEFLKEWQQDEEKMRYMEIAFYSERSIEDELARESAGDISTIVASYLIMFVYITFSLGKITHWKRFFVKHNKKSSVTNEKSNRYL